MVVKQGDEIERREGEKGGKGRRGVIAMGNG